MPSFDLDFEVICGKCGGGLSRSSKAESTKYGFVVTIDPCEDCLKDAHDEGYEEGEKNEN